jgi:hypothetical protein
MAEEMIVGGVIDTLSHVLIREIADFARQRDIEAILLQKELREKDALLNTHREKKKGKRVILKGQIIVSRDSIIREVEKIDREAAEKKEKKGKIMEKVIVVSSEEEEEDSGDELA